MNDQNYNDYFDFYGEDDKYLEKNDIIDTFEQLVFCGRIYVPNVA